jgi:general secretion pathway protein K
MRETNDRNAIGIGIGGEARPSERGFALILVIWSLALLAVIAAGVAAESRSAALVARNRFDLAEARATADAGVTFAVMGLFNPARPARWRADGQIHIVDYDAATIAIRVFDEGGKIDLNAAPIEVIGGLLDEFGIAPDQRILVTKAILARRQVFAAAAAKAATSERFTFHGSSTYATNVDKLAFADVSELRLMPGMTRAIYDRVSPYLTTYSQNPTVNPLTAARATLLAIPGVGPDDADAAMAARLYGDEAAPPPFASRYARVADPSMVTIEAEATTAGDTSFTRLAVAQISPDLPSQPVRILQWRQSLEPAAANDAGLMPQ